MTAKLDSKLFTGLEDQINQEICAAHNYHQVSLHLDALSFPGVARWFKLQHAEEMEHADSLASHAIDRGHMVKLRTIKEPSILTASLINDPSLGSSAIQMAFEIAEQVEQVNTEALTQLFVAARQAGDQPLEAFVMPFVSQQLDELADIREKLDILRRLKGDEGGLYQFDLNLGK